MTNFSTKKEWQDFEFYHLDALNIYLALKNREEEQIVDHDGNVIFKLPKTMEGEAHWFNLHRFQWESAKSKTFMQNLNHWTYSKCTYPEWEYDQATIQKTQIFTYKNDELIEFLENEYIISSYTISPTKLVLQLAINFEE